MGELHACRSCGSVDMVDLGACSPIPAQHQPSGHPIDAGRLLRCRVCAFGQRHPAPDAATLAAIYRETAAEAMAYPFEQNAAWSLARKRLVARLTSNSSPRVLDIGCHTGSFLGGLPTAWQKFGVESAVEPVRVASDQHGVQVIAERLDTIGDEWAGSFDAVTLFDVAEHLLDPAAGIRQAARMLKPGGLLLISSGDLDAWTWRWLGSGHWYLQTPQHLSLLSRKFIEHVATPSGVALTDFVSIPHRHAALSVRWHEAILAAYWGMRRKRGVYRLPHRVLPLLPGLGPLIHMRSVPWTMTLSDHFLVILESSQSHPKRPKR